MMINIYSFLEIFTLLFVSFSPLVPQQIKFVIFMLMLLRNYKYIVKFKRKENKTLFIFILVFLLGFIFDLDNIIKYQSLDPLHIYYPLCFLLGYTISQKFSWYNYTYMLEKIVFILAIFSLFGVIVYTFLPNLVPNLITYNYYHTSHKTAIFFNILTNTSTGVLTRNAGFAWEPGAFQIIVNLGLYLYIKNNENLNILKFLVYSISVLTTKSTAGLLIFLLIIFNAIKKDKKLRLLVFFIIVTFSSQIYSEVIYQIRYKLIGSYAFELRLVPFLNSFKYGKHYLFGIGNVGFSMNYIVSYIPPWDSFGQIFLRYGYPLLLFVSTRIFKLYKNNLLLMFIIIITFLSQNIWFFPFIVVFYFDMQDSSKRIDSIE